eukprot:75950_1
MDIIGHNKYSIQKDEQKVFICTTNTHTIAVVIDKHNAQNTEIYTAYGMIRWVVAIGICEGNKVKKDMMFVWFERIRNKYVEDIKDIKGTGFYACDVCVHAA